MHSKQLNFFITPEDLSSIDVFFKERKCLIIKNNVASSKIKTSYSLMKAKAEKVFDVYLSNERFIENIHFKYLSEKDYFYLDEVKSEVIHFSLGGLFPYSEKSLHRGRFYCINDFYDSNGILVSKQPEFKLWIANIYKDFKKQFLKGYLLYPNIFFSEKGIHWIEKHNAKPEQGGIKFVSA